MRQYLNDLQFILDNGEVRENRTETNTISVFGLQSRYDLQQGFPAVTTKKLAWDAVVSELLWFIEGSSDERRLAEILHGSRSTNKNTIWTANAIANYWKPKAKFPGDLGKIYGTQWRSWGAYHELGKAENNDGIFIIRKTYIDQLKNVIDNIKSNPFSRRHLVIAFNVADITQMALPPCHYAFQFYVSNNKLSCLMNMRSADYPLGVPFNIASYALLTHMVAQCCNLNIGELIITTADSHIYLNQIDLIKTQLLRKPMALPTLKLNPEIKNIDDFTMQDIQLHNYTHHNHIPFPFSV